MFFFSNSFVENIKFCIIIKEMIITDTAINTVHSKQPKTDCDAYQGTKKLNKN